MITTILIIIGVIVLIKLFGPILVELFQWVVDILTLPLAILGGFFGFIIEALFFVGFIWVLLMIFGE